MCFGKLDKVLQSVRGVRGLSRTVVPLCAHLHRLQRRCSFTYSLSCSVLGERARERSGLLCHPGTFKIIVLRFNFRPPGRNAVLLGFLVCLSV